MITGIEYECNRVRLVIMESFSEAKVTNDKQVVELTRFRPHHSFSENYALYKTSQGHICFCKSFQPQEASVVLQILDSQVIGKTYQSNAKAGYLLITNQTKSPSSTDANLSLFMAQQISSVNVNLKRLPELTSHPSLYRGSHNKYDLICD